MWFSRKQIDKQASLSVESQPHTQALRIQEIERLIELGFLSFDGTGVAGAFAVVATILAEHEARVIALEARHDA